MNFDRYTADPVTLAGEIEAALRDYGLRKVDKLFPHMTFREGELEMIARALRDTKRRRRGDDMKDGSR